MRDRPSSPIAVLGIGNVLLRDDGAGVWLVRRLAQRYGFTPEIDVIDGGTLGLALLSELAETERLVVVDAAKTGAQPGTVSVLAGADVRAVMRPAISAHDASLNDLLAALTLCGKAPRELIVVGIEPHEIRPSLDLSHAVRDALPAAEKIVIAELGILGVSAFRRERPLDDVLRR